MSFCLLSLFPDLDSPAPLEPTPASVTCNLPTTLYPLKTVTCLFLLFPDQARSFTHSLTNTVHSVPRCPSINGPSEKLLPWA